MIINLSKFNFFNKYIKYFIIIIMITVYVLVLHYKSNTYAKDNLLVKEIEIYGTNQKLKQEIQQTLKYLINTEMYKVDIWSIKSKILEDSKIRNVSVSKRFPNTIAVKIIEKKPFFIWQNNNDEFYIVNSEDKIVRKAKVSEYKNYVLIKGKSLNIKSADDIRFYIYSSNYLLNKVSTIEYKGYRWDLLLKNGIVIKLPELNIKKAVQLILQTDKKYQILSRKISYIDARIENKLFIKSE